MAGSTSTSHWKMSSFYKGFTPSQRAAAGRWLKKEIAEDRRPKASECMACGQKAGVLDYHSEDYSQPFGANIGEFQFCYLCHLLWHGRRRRPAGWEEYLRQLRAGAVFGPVLKRDLGALAFADRPETVSRHVLHFGPARPELIFDRAPFA